MAAVNLQGNLIKGTVLTLLTESRCALDGIRSCQRQVQKDGMTTLGTGGQIRAHPLFSAEAEYRRQLFAACRALRLNTVEV